MVIKEKKEKALKVIKQMKETYGEDAQINVWHSNSKKVRGMPDFVLFFQAINVTISKLLKPASCKLLLYFISKTGYDNYIGVNIDTITEELELSKRCILLSIKELEKYNIIIRTKDLGDKRRNVYFINPHQSWKGNFKKRIEVIKNPNTQQLSLDFDAKNEKIKAIMIEEVSEVFKNI